VPLAGAGLAYGCFAAIFRGWPARLPWILGVEGASAIVECGLSWWVIYRGGGVVHLLWLATAMQAAQLTAAAVLLSATSAHDDRMEVPSARAVAGTVKRSIPFALAGLIANAQQRLAPLLLGYLSGPSEVALFGAASRLGNIARAVPSAAFAGALPVLTERARRGRMEAVRRRFHRALQGFVIAAALGLGLAAPTLIRWTYGRAFSGAAPALVLVAVGIAPALLNASRRVYLYAGQRERVAVLWSGIALFIQAGLCAALIPVWGAVGAAAALMLGECAVWWPLSRA
jgi:O-antigen/teichoic acid export membrane protein